jgi:sulfonate transport system substrate-binding protein
MGYNKSVKIGIVVIILIGIFVSSYFLFFQDDSPEKFIGPVEKLTLGAETSLLTAAIWVAEEKGYFGEQNLDVKIEEFDSGKASLIAMLEGNKGIDISTAAPTPIMFNSFKRDDFYTFSTFVSSTEDVKVIARKDSGIRAAKDLVGKKVGIVKGSTSQFFLSAFLILRNLKDSDVETVDFTPYELPKALNDNKVDAIVIWEPHGYKTLQILGDNALQLSNSEVYDETFNFLVMRPLLKKIQKY